MTRRFFARAVGLALCAALAACKSSTSSTKVDDVPALQVIDKVTGTGTEATSGKTVTVHYTLWLYSESAADHKGTFQQSSKTNGSPFSFQLGTGSVIRGWDQGVPGMKVGGQRTLIIPSSLGYGPSGTGGIPGGSALVFDIELLDVR
jgi:FKBP-type peptidyl-prolyl cis-trans isomerase FkpA